MSDNGLCFLPDNPLNTLQFPHDTPPAFGTTLEIAPDVFWVRMPLPLALNHINLYLLRDTDGWYVLDTGMRSDDIQTYWQQIFAKDLDGLPVKGVIVTHMHPDHVGQAGWICDKFRVPLYMTRAEFYSARVMVGVAEGLSWSSEAFMRKYGASEKRIEAARSSKFRMAQMVEPLPMAYNRLQVGDVMTIAGRHWRVIIGEGHSPEHACFYCAELNVLLSGDQVIARITSNVSVMPMEPEANPLADWIRTLKQFYELPEDALVLPSHNLPFYGLHKRVEELIQHHEDHMVALELACKTPSALPELLPIIFKRELDDSQIGMAQGECIAHLHLLMERGLLERELCDDGLYRYTTIDPKLAEKKLPEDYHGDDSPQMV